MTPDFFRSDQTPLLSILSSLRRDPGETGVTLLFASPFSPQNPAKGNALTSESQVASKIAKDIQDLLKAIDMHKARREALSTLAQRWSQILSMLFPWMLDNGAKE